MAVGSAMAPWSNSNGQGNTSGNKYWHNPTVGTGPHFLMKDRNKEMDANASMEVMRNAFSDATTQPRVPDGKTTESIGFRKKVMAEIEQDGSNPIEILFFAGLNACIVMRGGRLTASKEKGDLSQIKYIRLEDHVTVSNNTPSDPMKIRWDQEDTYALCKWRPVSYGLLLSLVNSSDYNEGWWEAVRISLCDNMSTYNAIKERIIPTGGTGAVDKDVQPLLVVPPIPDMSSNQMLSNQSYSTGKLRNISQIVFQLNPELKEHDFLRVHDKIAFDGVDPSTVENPGIGPNNQALLLGQAQHNDQSADEENEYYRIKPAVNPEPGYAANTFDHLGGAIDLSYDAILIRIHGLPGGDRRNGPRRGSTVTALAVMNQELIYGDKSRMQTMHKATAFTTTLSNLVLNNVQAGTAYNLAQLRSYQPGNVTGGTYGQRSGFRGSGGGTGGGYNGAYTKTYSSKRSPSGSYAKKRTPFKKKPMGRKKAPGFRRRR